MCAYTNVFETKKVLELCFSSICFNVFFMWPESLSSEIIKCCSFWLLLKHFFPNTNYSFILQGGKVTLWFCAETAHKNAYFVCNGISATFFLLLYCFSWQFTFMCTLYELFIYIDRVKHFLQQLLKLLVFFVSTCRMVVAFDVTRTSDNFSEWMSVHIYCTYLSRCRSPSFMNFLTRQPACKINYVHPLKVMEEKKKQPSFCSNIRE